MSTKVRSARSRVFRLMKKTPVIIGCAIFLSSAFFPYLRFFRGANYADIWSFKVTFHDYRFGYTDSIINNDSIPLPELPWINIMILIAQILVLVAGVASVFVNKKILALVPLVFCFTVIMLIQYVSIRIGGSFFETGYYNRLQTGYYLTLFSLPFYLVAFIVELASSRRNKPIQETSSAMTNTKNTFTPKHIR
jgi:hypothetical protein